MEGGCEAAADAIGDAVEGSRVVRAVGNLYKKIFGRSRSRGNASKERKSNVAKGIPINIRRSNLRTL